MASSNPPSGLPSSNLTSGLPSIEGIEFKTISGVITKKYVDRFIVDGKTCVRGQEDIIKNVLEGDTLKRGSGVISGKNEITLNSYPWISIQAGTTETSRYSILSGVFLRCGLKLDKYYERMEKEFNINSTLDLINQASIVYKETYDPQYVAMFADDEEGGMKKKDGKKVLLRWFNERILRPLILLGIDFKTNKETLEEANKNELTELTIYNALTSENGFPEAVYCFNPKTIERILELQGRKSAFTTLKRLFHSKAYEVFTNVFNRKASYTRLTEKFKGDSECWEYTSRFMTEFYHFIIEEDRIYLPYAHEVETKVSEYLINLLQRSIHEREEKKDNVNLNLENYHIQTLTEEQKTAIKESLGQHLSIITGGAGTGKCLSPETPVLMYNSEIRKASDIKEGDILMGDDGTPRLVYSTTTGIDEMYEVIPERGRSFVCNKPHILTLKRDDEKEPFDMAISDFLQRPEEFKNSCYVYHASTEYEEVLINSSIGIIEYLAISHTPDYFNRSFFMNSRRVRNIILEIFCQRYGEYAGESTVRFTNTSYFDNVEFLVHSLGFVSDRTERELIVYIFPDSKQHFRLAERGRGQYAGFHISGNGRFLLGDLTITHNTTIISEILRNLKMRGKTFLISSFTGKAVSRIHQVLEGIESLRDTRIATTLDRAIARRENIEQFEYLIIDEISMVTTELFYRFITTFNNFPYKIIMIGDINQLEPVGWGCLLKELLNSQRVPVYYLTQNLRSNNTSIDINAKALISSERDFDYPFNFNEDDNFTIISPPYQGTNPNPAYEELLTQFLGLLKTEYNYTSKEITVLSPFKDVSKINAIFQHTFLSENQSHIDRDGVKWCVGDRVMMTKNNYDINVMNGDEGEVVGFEDDEKDKYMIVSFTDQQHYFRFPQKGERLTYDDDPFETNYINLTTKLIHSFGTTIHKSQGSEYKVVILYIPPRENNRVGAERFKGTFLSVNLLYTAITRAREKVFIFSTPSIVNQIASTLPRKRNDYLGKRITNVIQLQHKEIKTISIDNDDYPPFDDDEPPFD